MEEFPDWVDLIALGGSVRPRDVSWQAMDSPTIAKIEAGLAELAPAAWQLFRRDPPRLVFAE